ncbi:MAG: hypothetical protein V2B19_22350 [Pseudomonadota bacterium]
MTEKVDPKMPEFTLLGGPLYRMGCRLGLVRKETNTLWIGLALGLLSWGALVALGLVQGYGLRVFALPLIGVHVRLLLAIPLLFACETAVFPRMAEFVRNSVRSGLVPETGWPVLESVIRRVGRMKDSWLPELLFFVVTYLLPMIEKHIGFPGRTGNWESLVAQTGGTLTWTHVWYLGFCLPLFRFLLLRWLWHLGLWWYFLWRLEKMNLHLIPTHPDGAAGIGYLEEIQECFTPLVVGVSAIFSASFAEDIFLGKMAFSTLYLFLPVILIVTAALFIGPLFLFSRKLWLCRKTGLRNYMGMAYRYVDAFDRKWIRGENPSGDPLLGTPDMQSLADLNNSVNVVREMRWVPASQRLIMAFVMAVMIPMLPLVLLEHSVDYLAVQLFKMLTGL